MLALPFPNIDPIALQLGPLAIRWYGLAYAISLILGWLYVKQLITTPGHWADQKSPISSDNSEYLIAYVAAGVILGGRLGHVLFYQPGHYASNPLEIFAIWRGGMSFHGGVVGTALGIILFARHHRANMWSVGDLVCAAVPIGICLVRIANFINGEVVGHSTAVPWGIVFPGWGDVPRHPAMLYEALLEGAVLFGILYVVVHKFGALKTPGLTTAYFLIGYAVARLFCELFKIVDFRLVLPPWPITKGMVLSLPMLLFGLWLWRQSQEWAAAQKSKS